MPLSELVGSRVFKLMIRSQKAGNPAGEFCARLRAKCREVYEIPQNLLANDRGGTRLQ
jgi:hypothetical protein